jgi:hypothetical protein
MADETWTSDDRAVAGPQGNPRGPYVTADNPAAETSSATASPTASIRLRDREEAQQDRDDRVPKGTHGDSPSQASTRLRR